jgi:cell division protein FtsL
MNAAARGMHHSNLFQGQWRDVRVSKPIFLQTILLLAVLISALAVVYTTNVHRMTMSQLESAEQETHHLELQWGQLMLEQASLARPSRVQQLAHEQLHMALPLNNKIAVLRLR